ncbi:MAG: NADH-quinone oxidoreductase subunit NuoB [Candidatus Aureabacteria bacterium]|nr:NADH-quinone oxidoreductase subunit NuoB [Candidatus Auribacterota bacterium]
MSLKSWAFKKSPWVFHLSAGSCNNCDIEILDCLTPRYDVERFGILLVGSIRHADILLVTGAVNRKVAPRIRELYDMAPRPCLVVACGTCACGQHMFKESYHTMEPLDARVPVSVYVPGCPPKPEALISGIVRALQQFKV